MLAAAAAAGAGICKIPAGSYVFTRSAGGVGNISLVGDGNDTIVTANMPGQFLVGGNVGNLTIASMRLTGSVERMLAFSQSSNLKFADLWISGARRLGSGQPAAIRLDGCCNVEFTRVRCSGNGRGKRNENFLGADIQINGSGGRSTTLRFVDVVCESTDVEANVLIYDSSDVRGNIAASGAIYNSVTGHSGYGVGWYASKTNQGSCHDGDLKIVATNTEGSGFYCAGVSRFTFEAKCQGNGSRQPDATLPVGGVSLNGCKDVTFRTITVTKAGKDGVVFNNCINVRGTSIDVDTAQGWGVRFRGISDTVSISHIKTRGTTGGVGDAGDSKKAHLNLANVKVSGTNAATQGVALYGLVDSILGIVSVDHAGGIGIDIGGQSRNNSFCQLHALDSGTAEPSVYTGIKVKSDHSSVSSAVSRNDSTKNQRVGVELDGDDLRVGIIQASGNTSRDVKLGRGVNHLGSLVIPACPAS